MKKETVITKGTFDCPEILLETSSCLKISGNSTCAEPELSYDRLIAWIAGYQGDKLMIDIDLDFINCRSVRLLSQAIFKADSNQLIKDKSINWHFKDEEQEELGEMLSSLIEHSEFLMKFKQ
jgi:hypothetical protein